MDTDLMKLITQIDDDMRFLKENLTNEHPFLSLWIKTNETKNFPSIEREVLSKLKKKYANSLLTELEKQKELNIEKLKESLK